MSKKNTIKALEELVKTEHMAIAALDSALEETEDNKLRKNYKKWRDAHMKQAQALNDRLGDLGGAPVEYEVGSGKAQATLWGKLTGAADISSIAGMRIGAERGIKRYIDHLDDIDDPKTLAIIRRNLEAKQDEIEWYDSQANRERAQILDTKLDTAKVKAVDEEVTATNGKDSKKGGGLPFPLLVVLGALGAAAYFLMRRGGDDSDYEDYGEDAFRYEGEDTTTSQGDYTSSGSYSSAGNGASTSTTDYSTSSSGEASTAG